MVGKRQSDGWEKHTDVTEVNRRGRKVELKKKRNNTLKNGSLTQNNQVLYTKLYNGTLNSYSTGMCFSMKSVE